MSRWGAVGKPGGAGGDGRGSWTLTPRGNPIHGRQRRGDLGWGWRLHLRGMEWGGFRCGLDGDRTSPLRAGAGAARFARRRMGTATERRRCVGWEGERRLSLRGDWTATERRRSVGWEGGQEVVAWGRGLERGYQEAISERRGSRSGSSRTMRWSSVVPLSSAVRRSQARAAGRSPSWQA